MRRFEAEGVITQGFLNAYGLQSEWERLQAMELWGYGRFVIAMKAGVPQSYWSYENTRFPSYFCDFGREAVDDLGVEWDSYVVIDYLKKSDGLVYWSLEGGGYKSAS